jgi:hypothetical protein
MILLFAPVTLIAMLLIGVAVGGVFYFLRWFFNEQKQKDYE